MRNDLAQMAQSVQLQCVCVCVAVQSHEDGSALIMEHEAAQRITLEQLLREKDSEITESQSEREKLNSRSVRLKVQ